MRHTRLAFIRCSLMLCVAFSSSIAVADEASSTPASVSPQVGSATANAAEHPVGSATHTLLSLQSSNAAAAPARAGGGEEASIVYHRYLESFKHAIPAFFASSTGKGSGASSGTSN